MKWLTWEDLTDNEKEQAKENYIGIREIEEERNRGQTTKEYPNKIDWEFVKGCRFERMTGGYIYVDI